jgi:hypothetical protein
MSAAASNVAKGAQIITPKEAAMVGAMHVQLSQVPCFFGGPGIGKSDITKSIAQSLIHDDGKPWDLIICHPQVADPTDYKGLPAIVMEGAQRVAEFLPFGDLRLMINANRPLMVFLDDFGQAYKAVQAAIQQLILERRVDGHKISPFVRFVLCANRAEDKAGVEGFLTTIKTRCFLYTLEPTVDDWTSWAIRSGMPDECVAFVRWRGLESLWSRANPKFKGSYGTDNERTPRTVTNAFVAYASGLIPPGMELAVYSGATDGAWAIEWMAFLKTFQSLPNIDLIYTDPSQFECPPLSKPDVLYAVTAAIASRATPKNAEKFFKLIDKLPSDFGAFAVRDAYTRDKTIANSKWFMDWFTRNPDVIDG